MSAIFSSKIGKFAFAILSVSGASLFTANIISSLGKTSSSISSRKVSNLTGFNPVKLPKDKLITDIQAPDNKLITSVKQEDKVPEHKKCKIVLTSKDENYKVLTCGDSQVKNNRSFKVWWLFDSKKGSLKQIDGLTTKNDTGLSAFESTDAWWKSKKWQGYRGRTSHKNWGKEIISDSFELKYVLETNSIKFPFFNYLRVFCQGRELRRYKGKLRFLDSGCSYFDIPAERFKIHLIEPLLKQAFGSEKDICLIKVPTRDSGKNREFNWRENKEGCVSHPINN